MNKEMIFKVLRGEQEMVAPKAIRKATQKDMERAFEYLRSMEPSVDPLVDLIYDAGFDYALPRKDGYAAKIGSKRVLEIHARAYGYAIAVKGTYFFNAGDLQDCSFSYEVKGNGDYVVIKATEECVLDILQCIQAWVVDPSPVESEVA